MKKGGLHIEQVWLILRFYSTKSVHNFAINTRNLDGNLGTIQNVLTTPFPPERC